jgi:hypothetical protein
MVSGAPLAGSDQILGKPNAGDLMQVKLSTAPEAGTRPEDRQDGLPPTLAI